MANDIAISVKNLTKTYRIFGHPGDRIKQFFSFGLKEYHCEFTALRDVSFDIKRGESVGIIGRNGSGKSTLLQLICGILKPSVGTVQVNGRVSALLELGAGFNPEFTGRENVYFQGALTGFTKAQIDERFDEIAAFADIGEFIDQPVRIYSSGMYVRLAFAAAVHVAPDILVIDEALAVGDVDFQAKCLIRMRSLVDRGVTVMFVSHSIQAVSSFCDRALFLAEGNLSLDGTPAEAIELYRGHIHATANVNLTQCQSGRRGLRSSIELLSLSVHDIHGVPCTTFAMGARMLLHLEIRSVHDLPEARFGVMLTNQADSLVHDFTSSFSNVTGLRAGNFIFEIVTDPLMVYPGKYHLGAWAQRALGIPSDDYVRAALSITIVDRQYVGGLDAKFDIISKSNTEVFLPCAWRQIQ